MRVPVKPLAATASLALLWAFETAAAAQLETMVVTAMRTETDALALAGNISRLDSTQLQLTSANHPYELSVRVPGMWISRNSGQEQLTAIRSPVLTGPGSCGAFLVLEDGIPTRPTGFCNVNQLFEVPTEMADAIEVQRGPTNAYYGSNGLHGTINTLLPVPGRGAYAAATLEAGSQHFWRGILRWDSEPGDNSYSAGLLADHDGGYREESGYEQVKGFAKSRHELRAGTLDFSFSFSDLDQETAGFITGFEAYKDPDIRFTNPNPEAYRRADSRRFAATWVPATTGLWQQEYRFWLRDSDMNFLQHFLPGQPVEENGQTSGGALASFRRALGGGELNLGLETELATGYLRETQEFPAEGSDFLRETRPVGKHYDYDVDSRLLAGFANITQPLAGKLELQAGLRVEYLHYDYDNRMIDGNTRDDGTACGFGGCQFSRPADRTDDFTNVAPNAALLYRFTDETSGYISASRGFRAPQATELYRLQRGQDVADIKSEKITAYEAGLRHRTPGFALEVAFFEMRKKNFIFRDATDFNVSDGKTAHSGVELDTDWRFAGDLYFGFTGTYSDQEYRFDRDADLGETIVAGNQVDTAPKKLASARLGYAGPQLSAELEWVYMDEYFLDAANTATYEGHQLLNLRLAFDVSDNWSFGLRLTNLTDEKFADRADLLSIGDPADLPLFHRPPARNLRQHHLASIASLNEGTSNAGCDCAVRWRSAALPAGPAGR